MDYHDTDALPSALSAMSIDDRDSGNRGGRCAGGGDVGMNPVGGVDYQGMYSDGDLAAVLQQMDPEQRAAFEQMDPEQREQAAAMLMQQMMGTRPTEHFLTIALNGTILGATAMATGFLPDNLLMTSAFESVHDDDLLGMHAIKAHFWERDQPDVEVYLRRRSIEGGWIWLVAKVVSYIDSPVPGIIIQEAVVANEDVAILVSKITHIASLLLQAVETSIFGPSLEEGVGGTGGADAGAEPDGAATVQAMLAEAAEKMGVSLSSSDNPLGQLMAASNGDAMGGLGSTRKSNNKQQEDTFACLKSGASLDLSKIILSAAEVKLVALVLTGRLQIEDLGPLLYLALNSPQTNLLTAMEEFYALSEHQIRANAANAQSPSEIIHFQPPPLAVINLSFTGIGDSGMETLTEFIYCGNATLKTLDLGFCNITDVGLRAFCRGLRKRNSRGLPSLQGLVLTGNTITSSVAKDLGVSLSLEPVRNKRTRTSTSESSSPVPSGKSTDGLKLLHIGSTSISTGGLRELLNGLGSTCSVQEIRLDSNFLGPNGASSLVNFLEKKYNGQQVLPYLNRLNLSYNQLGDEGIAKLTRAISRRAKVHMTEVCLSGNDMGSRGIESIMNKLLQHNLVTLNLDNNRIGDQGCQLVAASLPSMQTLSRLNLSFNGIGCRGIATLMRSLIGCESITSLGLSGNIMRISGAIAMGYTLAQHPRLSTLELDNCCLSQVAQCHIAAGLISNRWVPMKVMHGFRAGPPMVAIGALEVMAQHLSNEECFRLRRDAQMKMMLQWMESKRNSNADQPNVFSNEGSSGAHDTPEGPSQNAYLRMLDWLGRIPFDESELLDLRKYFYDAQGSDGEAKDTMNLKHRGDLLAALASEVVEELEANPIFEDQEGPSVGLDLNKLFGTDDSEYGNEPSPGCSLRTDEQSANPKIWKGKPKPNGPNAEFPQGEVLNLEHAHSETRAGSSISTLSVTASMISKSESHQSGSTYNDSRGNEIIAKARITMFPQFAEKLDNLKAVAQEMMDNEVDPGQQDAVAQQFAEASLTILRQLRYHCMESGLDGWRQGKIRRKVLIVDDSVVTRKMVARAFEKANFIVDKAENGVEGVKKMKESIYDIAFMDIDMPVMNGFDATKALRLWEDTVRPGARQPICALTAADIDDFEREELMKFKDAGLDVMESKPCNIPRLFKVVDDVSPMFSDLSINARKGDEMIRTNF